MDGDGAEEHKFYRYGGMWKNKHEAVSAKKPKGIGKKKEANGAVDAVRSAHNGSSDAVSSSSADHMSDRTLCPNHMSDEMSG
jgi:hypothetical protein